MCLFSKKDDQNTEAEPNRRVTDKPSRIPSKNRGAVSTSASPNGNKNLKAVDQGAGIVATRNGISQEEAADKSAVTSEVALENGPGNNVDIPEERADQENQQHLPTQEVTAKTSLGDTSGKALDIITETGSTILETGVISLWDQAYNTLKDENFKLVEAYEKILSTTLQQTDALESGESLDETPNQISSDIFKRRKQYKQIAEKGMRLRNEKQIGVGGQKIAKEVVKVVLSAQEWIGDALQASPIASAAFAGVCIFLPLLTKAVEANEANLDGFAYITKSLQYYIELEPLLLPVNLREDRRGMEWEGVLEKFKDCILDVYKSTLEYQIKTILRFYRRGLGNYIRDIVDRDDWKEMLANIKILERDFEDKSQLLNHLDAIQIARRSLLVGEAQLETQQNIFKIDQEGLEIQKSNHQIHQDAFQSQRKETERQSAEQAQRWHQQFRLRDDNRDVSYEWYKNRVEGRIEGTCQWFLNHKKSKEWLNQESGALLVSADPGCGKSVLAKYLIDSLLPSRSSATICYFFFKDRDQNTVKQALCALLHQIFTRFPELIRPAMTLHGSGEIKNNTYLLWGILEMALQNTETGPVVIVLDALDECKDSEFEDLMKSLRRFFPRYRSKFEKVKILLTSRPYDGILSRFRRFQDDFPYIYVAGEDESTTIGEEVKLVIKYRVKGLTISKNLHADISQFLEQRLLDVTNRTYLWVYLVFDYLDTLTFQRTESGVAKALAELPLTVNQAYETILSKSQNRKIVRKALCIILAAERPLTLEEMNIAINVNAELSSFEELELETEDDFQETLRNWCGLFISVYDGKIYFLHQTARAFLQQTLPQSLELLPSELRWNGSISVQQANAVLAEYCLLSINILAISADAVEYYSTKTAHKESQLLLSEAAEALRKHQKPKHGDQYHGDSNDSHQTNDVDQLDGSHRKQPQLLSRVEAFLVYCSNHWIKHFRDAGPYFLEERVVSLAIKVCEPPLCSAWIGMGTYGEPHSNVPVQPNALTISCYFGNLPLVKKLLKGNTSQLELRDQHGRTPLMLAAGMGHETVVQFLLTHEGINVNAKTDADGGHDSLMNSTALWQAVYFRHEEVCKLLLERNDLEVDTIVASVSHQGRLYVEESSPVFMAAMWRSSCVLALMLAKQGVDPRQQNDQGDTLLAVAAKSGSLEVVKLLLQREDIYLNNTLNKEGLTPLYQAVMRGHVDIVKLLLEQSSVDVNLGKFTPLCRAVVAGHEYITNVLLQQRKVDVNLGTLAPLYLAVYLSGHPTNIVERLLARDDIKHNLGGPDAECSPLLEAYTQCNKYAFELLLARDGINCNCVDRDNNSLFLLAVKNCDTKTVKLLLGRDDVDYNIVGKHGSPLFCALLPCSVPGPWSSGRQGIMKLLLAKPSIRIKLGKDKRLVKDFLSNLNLQPSDDVKRLVDKIDSQDLPEFVGLISEQYSMSYIIQEEIDRREHEEAQLCRQDGIRKPFNSYPVLIDSLEREGEECFYRETARRRHKQMDSDRGNGDETAFVYTSEDLAADSARYDDQRRSSDASSCSNDTDFDPS